MGGAVTQPSVLRAIWLAFSHDVVVMVRTPGNWMFVVGLPVMMSTVVVVMALFTTDALEDVVDDATVETTESGRRGLIVAPVEVHDVLRERFGDERVEVVAERPDGVAEALASGALEAVATVALPTGVDDLGVDLELPPDAGRWDGSWLRYPLADWQVARLTEARIGPRPVVGAVGFELVPEAVAVEETQDQDVDATGDTAEADATDPYVIEPMPSLPELLFGSDDVPVAQIAGVMVLGMFGLMGLGLGPAILKSLREGFNAVLVVGTPAVSIYVAEIGIAALLGAMQTVSWWVLLGLLVQMSGLLAGVQLTLAEDWAVQAALLLALAPVGIAITTGIGTLGSSLFTDLPPAVREAAPRAITLVLFGVFVVAGGGTPLALAAGANLTPAMYVAAAVPGLGLLVGYLAWVGGTHAIAWSFALQVVYAIAATGAGAWVVTLDEGLLTHLRRRWRAR